MGNGDDLKVRLAQFRAFHGELLLRMDMQQRNVANSAFVAGAAITVIAALIGTMGLSKFLSHEAVLVVPGIGLFLLVSALKTWRQEEIIRHLVDYTQAQLADAEEYGPSSWNVETGIGRLLAFANETTEVLLLAALFVAFSVVIVFDTATRAGTIRGLFDAMTWLSVVALLGVVSVRGLSHMRRPAR